MEINRDKKNEPFTCGVISPVITYQRWKLTAVAGKYSGKRQMFCAELFKNQPALQKDTIQFSVKMLDGSSRALPNLRNAEKPCIWHDIPFAVNLTVLLVCQ